MKKQLSILLAIVMAFSLSTIGFASTETEQENQVYSYSSYTVEAPKNINRAYNKEAQAKIDAAREQAMRNMLDETAQSGEIKVVGTLGGKPLYAKTEVSTQTTKSTRTKSSTKTYYYDFGWGAGKEEVCRATVKGTFNVSGGTSSVIRVDGTYSILDDRCSAEWNDDLKVSDSTMCQIGFNLRYDGYMVRVSQSAFVDGLDGCYVAIYP